VSEHDRCKTKCDSVIDAENKYESEKTKLWKNYLRVRYEDLEECMDKYKGWQPNT
jgi:hypothetical protein